MTADEHFALLRQADEHIEKREYAPAEELALQVLGVPDRAQVLTTVGRIKKELSGAIELSDTNDVTANMRAQALCILGAHSVNAGNYEDAQTFFAEARLTAEEADNISLLSRALCGSAIVQWKLGDYKEALLLAGTALQNAEQSEYSQGQASALSVIGNVYNNLSDYPKALEYMQKSVAIDIEGGRRNSVARNKGNIGNVFWYINDYSRALQYYGDALAVYEELDNKTGIAVITSNIGNVYSDLGEYSKALEYNQKALMMAEEQQSRVGQGIALGNIGIVYAQLSDFPMSLQYFQKALHISEELGSLNEMSITIGNMGSLYGKFSDYTRALECFQKAAAIDESLGDRKGVALGNGSIGTVYVELMDYEKAMEHYQKSLQMLEDLGSKADAAMVKGVIGKLYAIKNYRESDVRKAEEYLTDAAKVSLETGKKEYLTHKSLADLYEDQGRTADALEQFKLYHDLEKEVQSEEAKKKAIQIEQLRQIAEREKEIAIAKAAASAELKATTSLLHKVLPESIARRMIDGEEEIADYFPNVSILFADIAGFTPLSADMPAYIVVRFLNFVFREFDRIIKKHGCEKIKTIGDGYMAIAGAPVECTDHAERIASAALEMMQTISLPDDIREYLPEGTKFGVRIGLHTGSVVAGVIGEERFVYDVYSDAVNTAARMESHGEPNRIHVSSEFVRHLQSRYAMAKNTGHGMLFERRGEMEIKGKGMMKTYFLGSIR